MYNYSTNISTDTQKGCALDIQNIHMFDFALKPFIFDNFLAFSHRQFDQALRPYFILVNTKEHCRLTSQVDEDISQ